MTAKPRPASLMVPVMRRCGQRWSVTVSPRRMASASTSAISAGGYRERYDIGDAHTALGAQVVDHEQRAARDRALAYTKALVAEIDRIEPDRPARELSREQRPGPELVVCLRNSKVGYHVACLSRSHRRCPCPMSSVARLR